MQVFAIATEWIGLIGALGGVLITGCVGLATAVLNHGWQKEGTHDEHERQRLETFSALQREAYSRYLAAYEAFENLVTCLPAISADVDLRRQIHEQDPVAVDEFYAAENHVRLLAGDDVVEALNRFTDAWQRALSGDSEPYVLGHKRALIDAMRAEQRHAA